MSAKFAISSRIARNGWRCANGHRMMIFRRWESSKGKKGENLPPLPPHGALTKAKERYLQSQKGTFDPQARIVEMNKELDAVRERAAEKLEKEINKSLYRKLTDPLRRYKHSAINIGAVTLAYILAHNYFVKSKEGKEARMQLEESESKIKELQGVLQSLLEPTTSKEMASICVKQAIDATGEDYEAEIRNVKMSWWQRSSTTKSKQLTDNTLEERLQKILQAELERRIGVTGLTESQLQQKSIKDAWQENQSAVEELSKNPERLLQALEELPPEKDGEKKERRVFSI